MMADNGKTGDERGDTGSVDSLPLSAGKGEVFSLESVDPALNAKMHLVNNVRKRLGLIFKRSLKFFLST